MNTPGGLYVLPWGNQVLVLTAEEFRTALERGLALTGSTATVPPSGAPEELITAGDMEARTKIKAAWFLEGARQGQIPHHRLGRYVRFRFDEVLACSRFRSRSGQRAEGAPR